MTRPQCLTVRWRPTARSLWTLFCFQTLGSSYTYYTMCLDDKQGSLSASITTALALITSSDTRPAEKLQIWSQMKFWFASRRHKTCIEYHWPNLTVNGVHANATVVRDRVSSSWTFPTMHLQYVQIDCAAPLETLAALLRYIFSMGFSFPSSIRSRSVDVVPLTLPSTERCFVP